jgi:hypothetical protein
MHARRSHESLSRITGDVLTIKWCACDVLTVLARDSVLLDVCHEICFKLDILIDAVSLKMPNDRPKWPASRNALKFWNKTVQLLTWLKFIIAFQMVFCLYYIRKTCFYFIFQHSCFFTFIWRIPYIGLKVGLYINRIRSIRKPEWRSLGLPQTAVDENVESRHPWELPPSLDFREKGRLNLSAQ